MTQSIPLNNEQAAMLRGERGLARQMGMRLVLDLAATAGATALVPIESAHLSGVSPLTGGLGLRRFLAKLAEDPLAQVAVPTTLNAAGCDPDHFDEMRIVAPNFLEHNQEIVARYTALGVRPTQSCIPYEWEGVVTTGRAAWAESNAICFGNSYCGLETNRDSGLSALAAALTGYTPYYGLLLPEARRPNILVEVTCDLDDPTDYSILGDWIGKQRQPSWHLPYGPIPQLRGIPAGLDHDRRKALTAAAANYGCPLLYIEGISETIPAPAPFEATLTFGAAELAERYADLEPQQPVSLVTIGCPQASIGELRATATGLRGKKVAIGTAVGGKLPVWVFTSSANKAIAEKTGIADVIRASGALLLANTCPEVVPYDQSWVGHILTNSMKAEHYIKSGLNGIPTSVLRLADCLALATGARRLALPETAATAVSASRVAVRPAKSAPVAVAKPAGSFTAQGHGLPSQGDFVVTAAAFVTDAPITFLGFVNRETGVIEEPGHPADGQSLAGTIAIFPKGTGSTVAPYVLLELYYRGQAPLAIANTAVDQQSAPACSLEGIPYAYGFDGDILAGVQHGDLVELRREGERVSLRVLSSG